MCKWANRIRVSSILLGFTVILLGCDPPADVVLPGFDIESAYNFDPITIQQSIMAGQRDVFRFEWERKLGFDTRAPEAFYRHTPIPGRQPVIWSEADFARIVQASIGFLGKEPMNDSRLFTVWFRTPCQYADIGPQLMVFGFFQIIRSPDLESNRYLRRWAEVDIEVGRLTWREQVLSEVQSEEESLDRSASYIPAEIALRVAEGAGGADFRASLGNACEVSGFLTAGIASGEWQVGYVPDGLPSATFEVQIDREAGAGKVIKTPTP
jgi:hypothetical protein